MPSLLIVGSGATGVHFARSALDRGYDVEMVDVGHPAPEMPLPRASYRELKSLLDDPERWFLGEHGAQVVYPAPAAKPYGFPPSKGYVFEGARAAIAQETRGFDPMLSFAQGGLAQAWTGGSYELRDEELRALGFDTSEMRAAYADVIGTIGVSATADDLQRFSPMHGPYQPSLVADTASATLLARYHERRARVTGDGVFFGRSRVAVLSTRHAGRDGCSRLGRCFWGCPNGAFYTPSLTLTALRTHPRFQYRSGLVVHRVLESGGRVSGVEVSSSGSATRTTLAAETVVLAAGALSTTRIYLAMLLARGAGDVSLGGLMDNGHVQMPFVDLRAVGRSVALDEYQYHMLALGIDRGGWQHDVHGQVTYLKAAQLHPVVAGLPFDWRTSHRVMRRIRSGLGIANLWLADERREANRAILRRDASTGQPVFRLEYDAVAEPVEAVIATARAALWRLGCIAPGAMCRVLPRGSSVHYAGTLPFSERDDAHTIDDNGEVRGVRGLIVADGAGFRWLPAKNITLTLMANAVRLAQRLP